MAKLKIYLLFCIHCCVRPRAAPGAKSRAQTKRSDRTSRTEGPIGSRAENPQKGLPGPQRPPGEQVKKRK
ncbi:unnamed protein product [Cercopithifilaria johnstoni]|uniref:Secreted protein n=1 Tax=Cercopithifilaria johnstoni TaxID=2874296 RepID=A0A8J2LZ40_9BILA|nr:unnamed protein product [Cercopithifilaria johnstoni]